MTKKSCDFTGEWSNCRKISVLQNILKILTKNKKTNHLSKKKSFNRQKIGLNQSNQTNDYTIISLNYSYNLLNHL